MLLVSHFSLQLDIFWGLRASGVPTAAILHGSRHCRAQHGPQLLGVVLQTCLCLLAKDSKLDSCCWLQSVEKNMEKKHVFSEKWECSEECGNISKNKRIDHANLRDFCVWPRDATLSGISFPITLQIAPVIVPLIMFSFDPRSPCPSRMGISKRYRSRLAQDLTPLLAEYKGPLAQPIIAAAGSDISFWFDEASRSKRHPEPLWQLFIWSCV